MLLDGRIPNPVRLVRDAYDLSSFAVDLSLQTGLLVCSLTCNYVAGSTGISKLGSLGETLENRALAGYPLIGKCAIRDNTICDAVSDSPLAA